MPAFDISDFSQNAAEVFNAALTDKVLMKISSAGLRKPITASSWPHSNSVLMSGLLELHTGSRLFDKYTL